MSGVLYLIPVPLDAEKKEQVLPHDVIARVHALTHFIAENPKAARAVLKKLEHPLPLSQVAIEEYSEHTKVSDISRFLAPLREGYDVGLMSEAGVPCVADPGEALVAAAHREGIVVRPEVGPSSILLALMASGLSGESFEFVGYLPVEERERTSALKALENDSQKRGGQTKIFIETPYRAEKLRDALIHCLRDDTQLCVASNLMQENQCIMSKSVKDWRQGKCFSDANQLAVPTPRSLSIFLLSAGSKIPL